MQIHVPTPTPPQHILFERVRQALLPKRLAQGQKAWHAEQMRFACRSSCRKPNCPAPGTPRARPCQVGGVARRAATLCPALILHTRCARTHGNSARRPAALSAAAGILAGRMLARPRRRPGAASVGSAMLTAPSALSGASRTRPSPAATVHPKTIDAPSH